MSVHENKFPLVTVITIVYNGEKYITETIESVITQTYKNIEYIIIDGGSTDGTVEIIKRYENLINHWISEPDNGMYDAINKGLSFCKGEIITYINSDDLYADNSVIKKVVDFFNKNKSIYWIYSDVSVINSNSVVVNYYKVPELNYNTYASLNWSPIPQPTTFWRREVMNECGIFNANLKMAGDYEFFLRVFIKYKPEKINFIIAKARHHANSLSSKKQVQNKIEHKLIIRFHKLDNIHFRFLRGKLYFFIFKFYNIHNYLHRFINFLRK
jgi:glycosyltransferase involved in cell wall biosynthesis